MDLRNELEKLAHDSGALSVFSKRRKTLGVVVSVCCFLALQFSCKDLGFEKPSDPCSSSNPPTLEWQFLGLDEESVTAIEVDPFDPNIIYVGTQFDFSAGRDGKLFKSIDHGKTWDPLIVGGSYRAIIADPLNLGVIYALPGSIIKSTDGGETWQQMSSGIRLDTETRAQSLAMHPTSSNILYAGTGGFFGGTLYKTSDAGVSWTNIWPDSLRDGAVSIAIDPNNTNVVYVGTAWRGLIVKTTDGGLKWTRTGLGERGIVHDILIDPEEPLRLFAGILDGIAASQDGGETWISMNGGLPENSSVMKIQQSKSANKLFIVSTSGDSGGIFQSNQMSIWERLGIDTLQRSYYYSDLTIAPTNHLYFGSSGGLFRLPLF